jgi:sulfotransferase
MKTVHFLAGLPRSGNTVLSSLLNQNPDIYSSPLSPVSSYLYNLQVFNDTQEITLSLTNKKPLHNVLKKVIENYYEDIEKPIIVDREKGWATPGNFSLLQQYINYQPKVIFTVRPIIEILTSFLTFSKEHSFIDKAMEADNWWYKNSLSKDDNRCDYLMRPGGQIDQIMLSFNEVLNPENKGMFHIVEYDDIVNNPETTMSKIYDFLKLPNYAHNFNNVTKVEKENYESLDYLEKLHEIRPQVNKVSKDPKDVLSDYVLNKYSNMEWWR